MTEAKLKFSNNIRTIISIVIAISCLAFYILKKFEIQPPINFLFFAAAMAVPITALSVNLTGMLAIKKVKDVSSSERRRLIFIANDKASKLKICILFYIISGTLINVLNAFSAIEPYKLHLTATMIGLIIAAIYSFIISFSENRMLSDFEAMLQERVTTEAAKNKFQTGKAKK